jgi:O-antigen/teichoic acid export membrane protein
VLGLPGSFGRYVEHYRQKGQLRCFLRRTTWTCIALALAATALVFLGRRWFSNLIFGSEDQVALVLLSAAALLFVIGYNFMTCLFTALRYFRASSILQFFQSLCFAVTSLALIAAWRADASSMVIGFGVASLAATVLSVLFLWRTLQLQPDDNEPLPHGRLWMKLMPFAISIWTINWLTNLFGITDRYMIIHYGQMSAEEALIQVGHYHSSRIVPLLLIAFCGMLGSVITPHLSHDWEQGNRQAVASRLHLIFKLLCLALTAGGAAVLVMSPFLFGVIFEGKFDGGLMVLPWTLTYCIWFGMSFIAQKYLWCAERARMVGVAIFMGLVINVVLNLVLLPPLGLLGAVLATVVANGIVLALLHLINWQLGMRADPGTYLISAVPLALALGPLATLAILAGVALLGLRGSWLFNAQEKRTMRETFQRYATHFQILLGRRTSLTT